MIRSILGMAVLAVASNSETLTLRGAQDRMLQANPDVLIQREEQAKAAAQLEEARSAFWPSLDLSASYQAFTKTNHIHLDLPPALGGLQLDRSMGDHDREEYGADLSVPLFTGGARWQQTEARKAALAAQAAKRRAVENQASLRLAALFYAWHMADAARQTQESVVEYTRAYSTRIAAVVKGGAALHSKEAGAKAKRLGAELELQTNLDSRDSAGRAAALLLGLPMGQTVAFSSAAEKADTTATHPAAQRPELDALEKTSESLARQEKVLAGQRWPSVVGLLGYRVANPGLNLGADSYMNYGLAGIQLRWNLFDGFRNRAQRAQTHAQQASVRLDRDRLAAFWDEAVLASQRVLARLEKSAQAAQAAWEAAAAALDETKSQHQHGVASDLEMLDAQVLEAQSGLRLKQLDLQRRLAEWQLRYARGETLRFPGD